MPPAQLRLLLALAGQLEVVIHAFCQYWGDLVTGAGACAWKPRSGCARRPRRLTRTTTPATRCSRSRPAAARSSSVLVSGPEAELVDDFVEPDRRDIPATLQTDVLALRGDAAPVVVDDDDTSLHFAECQGRCAARGAPRLTLSASNRTLTPATSS